MGEDPNDNSAIGVGAAVVVNVVHTKNDATLSGVANVGSLDIEALKLDIAKLLANSASTAIFTDNYAITATSGAGATTLGIAGSLALDLIDTESAASIASTSVVTVSSAGAVMLAADDETASGAVAKADVTGTGKVGIGASIALDIIANRSTAELANGATLTGAGELSLSATAVHTIATEADAGAAGGISVTPALALTLVNDTTEADLGTGATQNASGAVSLSASQQATARKAPSSPPTPSSVSSVA